MPGTTITEASAASAAVEPTITVDNISVENLMKLLHLARLHDLRIMTAEEFKKLNDLQIKVKDLHELLKAINAATSDKGDIDYKNNPELKALLAKAQTDYGIIFKDDNGKFTVDARSRLVENIRMTLDEFNQQVSMQLQAVQRLTNERYESYQMARTILSTLNNVISTLARKCEGR